MHELGGRDRLLGADGVGIGHAVLVLDAVLAAGRDVLVRRLLVVQHACGSSDGIRILADSVQNWDIACNPLTDHDHDLLDEVPLVDQAVALVGVLVVDGVERLLRVEVRSVVFLILLPSIICTVGRLLGFLDGQPVAGLTVQPGAESSLHNCSVRAQIDLEDVFEKPNLVFVIDFVVADIESKLLK